MATMLTATTGVHCRRVTVTDYRGRIMLDTFVQPT